MGYYTTYTMIAKGAVSEDVTKQIDKALEEKGIIGYILDRGYYYDKEKFISWDCADMAKWYDHEEDMCAISLLFPDVTFQLSGEGENQGDLWEEYYHNGECERCSADIVFPKPKWIKWPPDYHDSVDASDVLSLLEETESNHDE